MLIRPAEEADLAAERAVFCAAEGELYRRHGFAGPEPPLEAFAHTHRHLLAHDRERSFVAELEGRVVGFSAAFMRDETWFLSALFVDPALQSLGIGRRLLDHSWSDQARHRITITDAIQPVSNGIYARRGLIPTTPVLTLTGQPRAERPRSLERAPAEPAALRTLDLAAYGFDRGRDHDHWSSTMRCSLWLSSGRPIAYSYAAPGGAVGPIAGSSEAAAAAALEAELADLAGTQASVVVPGSSRELVSTGLAAGLRFDSPPGLLLLSPAAEPPRSLAISSYWLL